MDGTNALVIPCGTPSFECWSCKSDCLTCPLEAGDVASGRNLSEKLPNYVFLKGDIEDHGKTSFQDLLEELSSFNLFSSSKRHGIEKMVPAETPDSKHMKIT